MQKNNPFFDDFAKMASGAAGSFLDLKREMEKHFQSHVEQWMGRANLVTREEFEIVKAMAEKARFENEALRTELEALKKKPVAGKKPTTAKKKTP